MAPRWIRVITDGGGGVLRLLQLRIGDCDVALPVCQRTPHPRETVVPSCERGSSLRGRQDRRPSGAHLPLDGEDGLKVVAELISQDVGLRVELGPEPLLKPWARDPRSK